MTSERSASASGEVGGIRLSIAHLLLWMTTTAIFLAWLHRNRPPRVDEIHFSASFVSSFNYEDYRAHYRREQVRTWRRMNAQHRLGLIASPLNGIALAAVVLSLYEAAIRRFAFPAQPGHWLMLAIAVLLAHIWTRALLHSFVDNSIAEFVPAAMSCLLFAVIGLFHRSRVHWALAYSCLSVGSGAIAISFAMSPEAAPPGNLAIVGTFLTAMFPLIVAVCRALDLFERRKFDIFHWIGIGTLGGYVACAAIWYSMYSSIS